MQIVHTLPFFVRDTDPERDLAMAAECLLSLRESDDNALVAYNQGCLSNADLERFLTAAGIPHVVLGSGQNDGIPRARQASFEYVWEHLPNVPFVSEIHLDMVFPRNWYAPLLDFLGTSGEPIVSPGILTARGTLEPTAINGDLLIEVPAATEDKLALLSSIHVDAVVEGFAHPAVHNARILQQVGGYDCRFLTGKQGFEDIALLLGYLYYMGVRTNWRPKAVLSSFVYHATVAQRGSLPDVPREHQANLMGLLRQYGAYGYKHLGEMFESESHFTRRFEVLAADRAA